MLDSSPTNEESVTVEIGGTFRSRFFAAIAVLRSLWYHSLLAIAGWILVGSLLGKTIFAAETAALIVGVGVLANTLGIDPGQLLIRGSITFTLSRVVQRTWWGTERERGWEWVVRAEEKLGNLHIVLGWHRSRAVGLKMRLENPVYRRLRTMLIANGKLIQDTIPRAD